MTKQEKIKKTTLSDQVCKIIKQKIKEAQWPEGEKIPSENELAEAFGVNRLTVRNALQKLNAMGIVETRAGEGTFVKQFDILEYINEMSDLMTSPEMLEGVMDFRRCIELECGRLAVERANDQDIAELEQSYRHYEDITNEKSSFEDHMNTLINADLDFHMQVCRMSKNSLFVLAYSAVREPMFQYVKSVFVNRYLYYKVKNNIGPRQDVASSVALRTHREIIQAIKNRDFDMYKKTYIDMIDYENLTG
jgi:GntR family transcriptional repressor for pyruvate dehydrogenase complex